jgi:hypothetical protein
VWQLCAYQYQLHLRRSLCATRSANGWSKQAITTATYRHAADTNGANNRGSSYTTIVWCAAHGLLLRLPLQLQKGDDGHQCPPDRQPD